MSFPTTARTRKFVATGENRNVCVCVHVGLKEEHRTLVYDESPILLNMCQKPLRLAFMISKPAAVTNTLRSTKPGQCVGERGAGDDDGAKRKKADSIYDTLFRENFQRHSHKP